MKFSIDEIQLLKSTSNSIYSVLKPELIYHSNRIEGSTFTREELTELISRNRVLGDHPLDDVLEARNSSRVFDFVIDTLGQPLADDWLISVNEQLFLGTSAELRGETGHYKYLANYISGSKVQFALPSDVPDAMRGLLKEAGGIRNLEDLAAFHARFIHIHPFQDGNGRTGRFMMLKQCVECGIDLVAITEDRADAYRAWLEYAIVEDDAKFLAGEFAHGCEYVDAFLAERGFSKTGLQSQAAARRQAPIPSPAFSSRSPEEDARTVEIPRERDRRDRRRLR